MSQGEAEAENNDHQKEVVATKVRGTVKWFNVKRGFGFIKREDNGEDVFVHQTAITKNNPEKFLRSLGDGETVDFDIVVGNNGKNEASNVTGPDGQAVQGSKYAANRAPRPFLRRPRGGGYARGRGGFGGEAPYEGESGDDRAQSFRGGRFRARRPFGDGGPRGFRGGYRGRGEGYRYGSGGSPRGIEDGDGEFYGGYRGGRGFRPRGGRFGGGRGRFRGRGGFRGGFRGRGRGRQDGAGGDEAEHGDTDV